MAKNVLGRVFLHYIRILSKIQLGKINIVRKLRGKSSVKIIGITGSIGKTSTMYAVVAALRDHFKVKYSEKANSESGIPLNILGLKMDTFSVLEWLKVALLSIFKLISNWKDYAVYVVEMGVDEPRAPKNMEYLLKIVHPHYAIFLGVTTVHGQQFEAAVDKSLKGKDRAQAILNAIADEKAKLIKALPAGGYAILNYDDELVRKRGSTTSAKVIFYGESREADLRLTDHNLTKAGTSFMYKSLDDSVEVDLPGYVLSVDFGINYASALAAAQTLGVSIDVAARSLENNLFVPPGRSTLFEGVKGSLILDSSYNASPKAMLSTFELYRELNKEVEPSRRLAVLGDMRELGKNSKFEHQNVAEAAVSVFDDIVLVGPEMEKYFLPKAIERGFGKEHINAFATAGDAARFLHDRLSGGELILVKGSQNTIFLEIVVEALAADPKSIKPKLCRRGRYWDNQRRKYL